MLWIGRWWKDFPVVLLADSTSFIGISQPKNTHISLNMTETILADLNRYTTATHLVIILTDDAIKHTCVWPLAWCNKWKPYNSSTPLQSDFSTFRSPVKEKGKQGRMKGLNMVQWINLNWNNRSVLACQYSVLWGKFGPILLLLVGLMAGWQDGRRNTDGFRDFKIFRNNARGNYRLYCYV